MAPRSFKKIPPGPGSKRALRMTRAAAMRLDVHPEESDVKAEEEEDIQFKEEVPVEELTPIVVLDEEIEVEKDVKVEENGNISPKNDVDSNEPIYEYEKDERLDFEDNDPEYDHEEYGGEDYDENENEQDREEEENKVEELEEEDIGEDEGCDVEEELEVLPEELEADENDNRVVEGKTEMADATVEQAHHVHVKERRKRKEFEIFVGGLDKDATENDLRKVFSEVGQVTEVRLLVNPQNKKNKGFAFLRFATVEQAKRACTQLKNPMVNGKQCGVTPSQDSDTLFLGNICKTWKKENLREKLKHYGVENIEDLTLGEHSNDVGMNRGFAFLEFSSRADAMDAFKRLQKRDVVFGVDIPAKVSFADSFIDPSDEIMAQVKTVFMDGLSSSWDEDRVKDLLKGYGKIEKVELARNMPSARRKDFGFVTFDSHDAAATCAKNINNQELGVGDHKAKVRARLSRPLQRGKGKHIFHGEFQPVGLSTRGGRSSWGSVPRSIPLRQPRGIGRHLPPVQRGFKWPINVQERRQVMNVHAKSRPIAPSTRSYDRRPPVPPFTKGGLKRDYARREEFPHRNRASMEHNSRNPSDRRASYRVDYSPHGSGFSDLPRGSTSHFATRTYIDDGYNQSYERPPPSYGEGRGHEYNPVSGSKRPYTAMDDSPHYGETGVRHSRARLDYMAGNNASHYGDAYSDSAHRHGRLNLGYSGSRSSLSSQDSHRFYGDRQGMGYNNGGSYGGSDVNDMYSTVGGGYMRHGSNVGGSSYSSLYSGRGFGGNDYMGSGNSEPYY